MGLARLELGMLGFTQQKRLAMSARSAVAHLWFRSLITASVVLTSVLFAEAAVAEPERPLQVVVSTQPLLRVIQSVAPTGSVEVNVLLPRAASPHDATLRPRQLQQLVDADWLIWMGPVVEPYLQTWIQKRQGPSLDVTTLEGVIKLPPRKPMEGGDPHDHDSEAGHQHSGTANFDVHLWWSRENLLLAADAVAERLIALRPNLKPEVQQKRDQLQIAMQQLATEYPQGGTKIQPFAVFHDGWQYLERDLGQKAQAGFVLDGELAMSLRHLAKLKQHFRTHPVACVLIEPGMNTALVGKVLPDTPTVLLDPMGWDVPSEGIVPMLRHAYESLARCGRAGAKN
ncbi:high-affinity zinc uptake system protein [gamma proteobacterium HdN1]|nr:high-affinity zinc uptake system protein [gamma proteobacterium HdN1]